MHPRFSLPVTVLALSLATVIGTAVIGFLGAAVQNTQTQLLAPTRAMAVGAVLEPVFFIVLLGAVAGVLGWAALFSCRRDGFHRIEYTAMMPFNYGGKSPFDTSDWRGGQ